MKEVDFPIKFLAVNSKPLVRIETNSKKNKGEVNSRLILRRATIYPFVPFVFYKECAEIHVQNIHVPRKFSNQVYLLPKFQLEEFVEIIKSELFQSFCNLNQQFDYSDLFRRIVPKWFKKLLRYLKNLEVI